MVPRTGRKRTDAAGNGLGNASFGPGTFRRSRQAGRRGHVPVLRQQRRRSDQRRHQTERSRTAPSTSNLTFFWYFYPGKIRQPVRTLRFRIKKKKKMLLFKFYFDKNITLFFEIRNDLVFDVIESFWQIQAHFTNVTANFG